MNERVDLEDASSQESGSGHGVCSKYHSLVVFVGSYY